MSATVIAFLDVALLALTAAGFATCHRELRALRRALAALDEGQGRRAAALVAGLQALREPLDVVRAAVEELSPNRRDTVEQRAPAPARTPLPRATAPEPTGLRLDLPRTEDDDRDSEGETRVVRQPTAAELAAAGAVGSDAPALAAAGLGRPRGRTVPPASGRTGTGTLMSMPTPVPPASASAPRVTLRAVCRLCEGGGVVRARSGGLVNCRGCNGSGYVDPEAQEVSAHAGEERNATLPG